MLTENIVIDERDVVSGDMFRIVRPNVTWTVTLFWLEISDGIFGWVYTSTGWDRNELYSLNVSPTHDANVLVKFGKYVGNVIDLQRKMDREK